ncbi:hypothetical protein D9M71_628540 [compost metagenome]
MRIEFVSNGELHRLGGGGLQAPVDVRVSWAEQWEQISNLCFCVEIVFNLRVIGQADPGMGGQLVEHADVIAISPVISLGFDRSVGDG